MSTMARAPSIDDLDSNTTKIILALVDIQILHYPIAVCVDQSFSELLRLPVVLYRRSRYLRRPENAVGDSKA